MKTQIEVPNKVVNMLSYVVHYCAPTILAEMVDDWSQVEGYGEMAQIALAEGIANCGLEDLAKCVSDDTTKVLQLWRSRGLYW